MSQMPPLKCVEPDIRMSGCTKQNNNWQHNSHDVVPLSLTRPFGAGSVQYGSSNARRMPSVFIETSDLIAATAEEIGVLHSGGAPKPARAGHVAAMRGGAGAILGHEAIPDVRESVELRLIAK